MRKREISLTVSEIPGDSRGWKKEAAEIFAVRLQELSKEEAEDTDEIESGLDELIATLKGGLRKGRHREP